jgi:hypothetical protein
LKTIIINLLIVIFFLQGSCKRIVVCPTYRLPQATQTGANTFGCRVNGKVCIPKSSGLFSPTTRTFSYNEVTGELMFAFAFLSGDKDYECGMPKMSVRLSAENVYSIGEVSSSYLSAMVNITEQYQQAKEYIYGSDLQSISIQLEITKLDTGNKIISGLFQFEGYRHLGLGEFDLNQKAIISDGRFDFKYNLE